MPICGRLLNEVCIVVFVYYWRAVIAGNESNLEHDGNIANNYLQISETFFIK
jgi:hypothetical protein